MIIGGTMLFAVWFFIALITIFIFSIIFKSKKNNLNINFNYVTQEETNKYKNILLNHSKLTELRKYYIYCLIICSILFLVFFILGLISVPIFIFIGIFIMAICPSMVKKKYNKIYKEEVLKKIIKEDNNILEYYPDSGMDIEDYKFAKFEKFDKYESEDLLIGQINGLKYSLADVHTYRRDEDSDGSSTYVTLFNGSVARLETNKNLNSFIYILNNQIKLFNNEYFISIDNENFEKMYDVYSDNAILAMRLLTPDITTSILNLTNKTGIYTEIKLYNNLIYFRFYTGNLFEANILNSEKEAVNIAYYFKILKGINEIMQNILNAIDEVEL